MNARDLYHLVGVPFLRDGRTIQGMDCLGIVGAACALLSIPWQYPAEAVLAAWHKGERCLESVLPEGWEQLPAATPLRLGDVPLSSSNGAPAHVSMALGSSDVLHTTEATGCYIMRARTLRPRTLFVYRHRSRAAGGYQPC